MTGAGTARGINGKGLMGSMQFLSECQAETERLGEKLGRRLAPGAVVALFGPLGAGKTAFVRGMCRALGYRGQVTSPTFALAHEYEGDMPIVHFDLYRIQDAGAGALEDIGYYDALDGRSVLAIEWSDNFLSELPEGYIAVNLSYGNEPWQRVILIEGGGF